MKVEKEIVIKNKTGLHARPAALFVQVANKFDSEITITKDDNEVNGKIYNGNIDASGRKRIKDHYKGRWRRCGECLGRTFRNIIAGD